MDIIVWALFPKHQGQVDDNIVEGIVVCPLFTLIEPSSAAVLIIKNVVILPLLLEADESCADQQREKVFFFFADQCKLGKYWKSSSGIDPLERYVILGAYSHGSSILELGDLRWMLLERMMNVTHRRVVLLVTFDIRNSFNFIHRYMC